MGERPILWISAVSNRCQPAAIKEESTSLKHWSFIRPQLCATLMVIIASKVAPQFSRDPIWKLSRLNLWVLRWMSLISDLIFNYVLTHHSTIFIMTCREQSFTSSSMSQRTSQPQAFCSGQGKEEWAAFKKVKVWSVGVYEYCACGSSCYTSDDVW